MIINVFLHYADIILIIMVTPLDELIISYYARYDNINRVKCKALNSFVYFTSEGRLHLLYKSNRKKRNTNEQRYKLKLFPLVIPVIKYSDKIQDWRFLKNNKMDDIQYYAIVGKAGKSNLEVRVVTKRTGNGQFNFHSVMENKKSRRIRRG